MSWVYLQIKNPQDDETTIEAQVQVFSSLFRGSHSLLKHLVKKPHTVSFEIFLLNQTVYFYITCDSSQENFVTSLISASYPKSVITKTQDPVDLLLSQKHVEAGELKLGASFQLPIKTYQEFAAV